MWNCINCKWKISAQTKNNNNNNNYIKTRPETRNNNSSIEPRHLKSSVRKSYAQI